MEGIDEMREVIQVAGWEVNSNDWGLLIARYKNAADDVGAVAFWRLYVPVGGTAAVG